MMVYVDLDDVDKMFNRRDFLLTTAVALLSGKAVYDSLIKVGEESDERDKEVLQRSIEDKIYNEYPKYQHLSKTMTKVTMTQNGETKEHLLGDVKGYGIVVGDKYVTVAHVVNNVTPVLRERCDKVDAVTILYGIKLKKIVKDLETDIAVFQIPKGIQIKYRFSIDDICFDEPKLGEEMYIVGNPALMGTNIRKGYVSDIDGVVRTKSGKPGKNVCFSIDKAGYGGDSGTYSVNKKGQVSGILSEALASIAIYAVKMKMYEKYLR